MEISMGVLFATPIWPKALLTRSSIVLGLALIGAGSGKTSWSLSVPTPSFLPNSRKLA